MGKVGEYMGRRHAKLLIKLYSPNQGQNRNFYFEGLRLNDHIDSQFKKKSKYQSFTKLSYMKALHISKLY